jgi:chromate reductase
VGIILGSLRKDSFSKRTAKEVVKLFPEGFETIWLKLGDLPIYNQDYDDNPPMEWTAFREEVKSADSILFVTPEYNRSIPPVLKNALDIASRPYGKNVWDGKPGAVICISPGKIGGFGVGQVLRQTTAFLNIPMLSRPEMYLGNITELLDKSGGIFDTDTQKFLRDFVDAYVEWVEKFV